ncbi:MAG: hypothetical protein MI923_00040 [Phycisphaerales bacterium]|nr:hypothetical protein [Phycisphaerales bacterium]
MPETLLRFGRLMASKTSIEVPSTDGPIPPSYQTPNQPVREATILRV